MLSYVTDVKELIKRLGVRRFEGSSVSPGVPYQNIPGVSETAHRVGSDTRSFRINELIELQDKTVLDLGCNVGSISGALSKFGAKVTGIDHDEDSIAVAQAVHTDCGFSVGKIDLDFIKSLPHYDVIVWLSQFNWLVRQKGAEHALDCLWEIGKHCDTLVFETAGRDDGMAPIDCGQEEVYALLARNTIFTDITDCGQWDDDWTPRNVFVCKRPLQKKEGFFADVFPGVRGQVIKKFKNHVYGLQLKERGAMFLKLLASQPNFPRLISESPDSFIMSWEGPSARFIPDQDVYNILTALRSFKVTHRDVQPENLVFNGSSVVLIDFSFAVFPREITRVPKDLGGIFKCPVGFNDEYSFKKVQQHLMDKGWRN